MAKNAAKSSKMIPKTPEIMLVRLSAKITIANNTLNNLSTSPIFAFITLFLQRLRYILR